eukprot:scaffold101935_cov62-Phaeocystis_antarctica.AAC.4
MRAKVTDASHSEGEATGRKKEGAHTQQRRTKLPWARGQGGCACPRPGLERSRHFLRLKFIT